MDRDYALNDEKVKSDDHQFEGGILIGTYELARKLLIVIMTFARDAGSVCGTDPAIIR